MFGSILFLGVTFVLGAGTAQAQSPYAGQEARQIKALSADEVQQYLSGQGMGFAKAAELNRYPGPKHVLEFAEQLALTDEQTDRTREIFAGMKTEAVRLGELLVAKERELDQAFAAGRIGEEQLQSLVEGIARIRGQLRATHLKAHLEMKRILTPHQIRLYAQLRGYAAGHSHRRHQP